MNLTENQKSPGNGNGGSSTGGVEVRGFCVLALRGDSDLDGGIATIQYASRDVATEYAPIDTFTEASEQSRRVNIGGRYWLRSVIAGGGASLDATILIQQ